MNIRTAPPSKTSAFIFPGANGELPLSLGWQGGWQTLTITGGPFNAFKKADEVFGICVRKEDPRPNDIHVPIVDFRVPTPEMKGLITASLSQAFRSALTGKHVYVGCQGGWGRTGLFLALMAKVAGVADPVAYVREHYTSHAVETSEQQAYVHDFDVTQVRAEVLNTARGAALRKLMFWR